MTVNIKKTIALTAIIIVFSAIVVSGVHHHLPNPVADHDCEICNFINVLNTAILQEMIVLWIISVFAAVIALSEKYKPFEKIRINPSRAPPFVLL